ncbi:MAG: hypothetical protein QOH97_5744 [Actinoplanes sp.]|jgi:hypothetical protein|nr:hypothetical protein [Actinoplanes sp.]
MTQWAVIIPAQLWATERLFQHQTLTVPGSPGAEPVVDDEVLLVAGASVVALGRVVKQGGGELVVAYTRRAFDSPAPAAELAAAGRLASAELAAGRPAVAGELAAVRRLAAAGQLAAGRPAVAGELAAAGRLAAGLPAAGAVVALAAGVYDEYAARLGGDLDRRTWLVSVDLPIEATTPAEAVRLFWSYVAELGPAELPAFVSPAGNELAMQAFVLGEEANLDPEEDDG